MNTDILKEIALKFIGIERGSLTVAELQVCKILIREGVAKWQGQKVLIGTDVYLSVK